VRPAAVLQNGPSPAPAFHSTDADIEAGNLLPRTNNNKKHRERISQKQCHNKQCTERERERVE